MPLTRVLETEAMDSLDEARDYDAMDHREVNRRFVDDFLAAIAARDVRAAVTSDSAGALPQPTSSSAASLGGDAVAAVILDLGTGTAQIPIALCRAHARCRVVAVDLAASMLEVARANVAAASLADRIELRQVDAKGLPFGDGAFAAVMSNSIVHHAPQPRFVLAEAVRVLAGGGLIFFRDLLRPASQTELDRLVSTYAADANRHQRQMFADSLHAALDLAEISALVSELGFPAASVEQTSDRHWTWAARKV